MVAGYRVVSDTQRRYVVVNFVGEGNGYHWYDRRPVALEKTLPNVRYHRYMIPFAEVNLRRMSSSMPVNPSLNAIGGTIYIPVGGRYTDNFVGPGHRVRCVLRVRSTEVWLASREEQTKQLRNHWLYFVEDPLHHLCNSTSLLRSCLCLPIKYSAAHRTQQISTMKNLAATALLFVSSSLGPAVLTEAATEKVVVREDGIKFFVRRFEGKSKPYRVRFSTSTTDRSDFWFKEDGSVNSIKAGTEKYVVRYRSSGALRTVLRKDSGARMLVDEEELDAYMTEAEESAFDLAHRSLYYCDDCEEKWNAVCGQGISTVCNVMDHSSLGTKGAAAVEIMCNTFGSACESISAEKVCRNRCVQGEWLSLMHRTGKNLVTKYDTGV